MLSIFACLKYFTSCYSTNTDVLDTVVLGACIGHIVFCVNADVICLMHNVDYICLFASLW